MAIPAVKALKRGRPDAWLAVLVPEGIADVWRTVAEVDAVIPKGRRAPPRETAERITAVANFDVAMLSPNSPRSAMEVKRAGIPRVVGYRGKWRSRHIDQIIREAEPGPTRHHVHHYLDVAAQMRRRCRMTDDFRPHQSRCAKTAGDGIARIGLCPGAEYGASKRWPPEKYADCGRIRVAEELGTLSSGSYLAARARWRSARSLEAMLQWEGRSFEQPHRGDERRAS